MWKVFKNHWFLALIDTNKLVKSPRAACDEETEDGGWFGRCVTPLYWCYFIKMTKTTTTPTWLLLFPTSPPTPPGNTRFFPPRHPERMADGDITDDWLQRHQRLENKTRVKEQLMLVCSKNKEVHCFLDFDYNIEKWGHQKLRIRCFCCQQSGGGTARHSACVCVCVCLVLTSSCYFAFWYNANENILLIRTNKQSRWFFHATLDSYPQLRLVVLVVQVPAHRHFMFQAIPSGLGGGTNPNYTGLLGTFSQVRGEPGGGCFDWRQNSNAISHLRGSRRAGKTVSTLIL